METTYKLRTGQTIIIDPLDLYKIMANPWFKSKDNQVELMNPTIDLAHFLLGVNPKSKIIHINGNDLDFRKENLKGIEE